MPNNIQTRRSNDKKDEFPGLCQQGRGADKERLMTGLRKMTR